MGSVQLNHRSPFPNVKFWLISRKACPKYLLFLEKINKINMDPKVNFQKSYNEGLGNKNIKKTQPVRLRFQELSYK